MLPELGGTHQKRPGTHERHLAPPGQSPSRGRTVQCARGRCRAPRLPGHSTERHDPGTVRPGSPATFARLPQQRLHRSVPARPCSRPGAKRRRASDARATPDRGAHSTARTPMMMNVAITWPCSANAITVGISDLRRGCSALGRLDSWLRIEVPRTRARRRARASVASPSRRRAPAASESPGRARRPSPDGSGAPRPRRRAGLVLDDVAAPAERRRSRRSRPFRPRRPSRGRAGPSPRRSACTSDRPGRARPARVQPALRAAPAEPRQAPCPGCDLALLVAVATAGRSSADSISSGWRKSGIVTSPSPRDWRM